MVKRKQYHRISRGVRQPSIDVSLYESLGYDDGEDDRLFNTVPITSVLYWSLARELLLRLNMWDE